LIYWLTPHITGSNFPKLRYSSTTRRHDYDPTVTIQKSDPDVIVGHEFLGVSLDVLLGRMKDLRADHWSRVGRFRRTKMNLGRPGTNLKLLYGRLVCDLASDGAKVRGSNHFLWSSIMLVRFLYGRLSDLDRSVVIAAGVFKKHAGHHASNAAYLCHDHRLVYHFPTLQTRRARTNERTARSDKCVFARE